jgi:hypothetical protein
VDVIRPDFTIDEVDSHAARTAFEAKHPEEVEALVAKEQQRRLRKQAKAGQAEDSDDGTQRTLDLDAPGDDDGDSDVEEELSA